ncbi:MAG: hypothetical protein ACHQ49_03180 [Elusimicrobiota bacterium]
MSLICPLQSCRKEPGMCAHDKVLLAAAMIAAAMLAYRLTF